MLKQIDKLQTAIDRILEIDELAIGKQMLSANELQVLVDTIDPEFNHYSQRHCNKTGKPLGRFSPKAISQLIHIHGRNKAKFALESMHMSQYAVEWLFTDSDALAELTKVDPVGYFIYASAKLLEPFHKRQQMCSWELHREKVNGWQACNDLQNDERLTRKVIRSNELMRRLLGVANPAIAHRHIQFTQTSLSAIASCELSVDIFIAEIESSLIALVEHAWKEKNTISAASLADLKHTYQGATAFHQQVKLRGLSQVEAVLYDMREFMDGKSANTIEVLVGLSQQQCNLKPTAEVFTAGAKVKLKIAAPATIATESDSPIKQNPFAAAFAKANHEGK